MGSKRASHSWYYIDVQGKSGFMAGPLSSRDTWGNRRISSQHTASALNSCKFHKIRLLVPASLRDFFMRDSWIGVRHAMVAAGRRDPRFNACHTECRHEAQFNQNWAWRTAIVIVWNWPHGANRGQRPWGIALSLYTVGLYQDCIWFQTISDTNMLQFKIIIIYELESDITADDDTQNKHLDWELLYTCWV